MVDLEIRVNNQDYALLESGEHRYFKLRVSNKSDALLKDEKGSNREFESVSVIRGDGTTIKRPFRGAWLTSAVISGRPHPVHAIKINSNADIRGKKNEEA